MSPCRLVPTDSRDRRGRIIAPGPCAACDRLGDQLMEFTILDFSAGQDRAKMVEMFQRLERGLRKSYR